MIDDIIQSSNTTFDKDSYRQRKKEQLQYAYKLIESGFEEINKGNGAFLKSYLDIQSRFDKYTIRNALLVAKQNPNAIQLKDYNSWKEAKATFRNPKQQKILVLEPKNYTNKDGQQVNTYNAKELIDISETNLKPYSKNIDKRFVLQALLSDLPLKVVAVDSLENGKQSNWDKDTDTIHICRTNDYDLAISSLATEIAKSSIFMHLSEISDEKAQCVGYMICKKYGVDYPLGDISNTFVNKNMETMKIDLEMMKVVYDNITDCMRMYLEDNVKDTKNKDIGGREL